MSGDKSKGQYFTTHPTLQQKVLEWIHNQPECILEPSAGRGDLVNFVTQNWTHPKQPKWVLVEIDTTLDSIVQSCDWIHDDFLQVEFSTTFVTIIGNPPYVRRKGKRNLYLDFIDRCVDLLSEHGELIFIVPSDFLTLTSAQTLLEKMFQLGCFTDIFFPRNEKLFSNASIDVMVFRYVRNEYSTFCNYDDTPKQLSLVNGVVHISSVGSDNSSVHTLGEYFGIYVGLVSGKDRIFQSDHFGNIDLLKDENVTHKYILLDHFPTGNSQLNDFMVEHKTELMDRKITQITEKNWWKWGALRNLKIIQTHFGKPCIYVKILTRSQRVAFISTVGYFSGNLIMMVPLIQTDLSRIVEYLNNPAFRMQHTYSGRFKITHRQLSATQIQSQISTMGFPSG